jgi:hypothetical protein
VNRNFNLIGVSLTMPVAVLPGVRRPMALGFQSDEIRRTITLGE